MAFLSAGAVEDFIARIISAVTTSAEYDEFLLFKYLLIKAISHGKMYPKGVDTSDIHNAAIAFRGVSNGMTFMNTKYNIAGVHTTTPKESQYIFMDAEYNAQFDVGVLASAFNMDKADFMGKLLLIDNFTEFDSDRFSVIIENSDMIEPVTAQELALMANVKAVLLDGEWFQVYDNLSRFTEQYVASGLYWNYFYNVWKTVASSSYSNAIVFIDSTAGASAMTLPNNLTATIQSVSKDDANTVITLTVDPGVKAVAGDVNFVQTEDNTENGVAVHPYGAYIVPIAETTIEVVATAGGATYKVATDPTVANLRAGGTLTLAKQ